MLNQTHMSERTTILQARNRNQEISTHVPSLVIRIFDAINRRYDSVIDFLFKWTN